MDGPFLFALVYNPSWFLIFAASIPSVRPVPPFASGKTFVVPIPVTAFAPLPYKKPAIVVVPIPPLPTLRGLIELKAFVPLPNKIPTGKVFTPVPPFWIGKLLPKLVNAFAPLANNIPLLVVPAPVPPLLTSSTLREVNALELFVHITWFADNVNELSFVFALSYHTNAFADPNVVVPVPPELTGRDATVEIALPLTSIIPLVKLVTPIPPLLRGKGIIIESSTLLFASVVKNLLGKRLVLPVPPLLTANTPVIFAKSAVAFVVLYIRSTSVAVNVLLYILKSSIIPVKYLGGLSILLPKYLVFAVLVSIGKVIVTDVLVYMLSI